MIIFEILIYAAVAVFFVYIFNSFFSYLSSFVVSIMKENERKTRAHGN